MAAYLTLAEYRTASVLASQDVDEVEAQWPGFVAQRLDIQSSWIDGKLRKRYAAPFAAPVPKVILGWLAALVDRDVILKRSANPSSLDLEELIAAANRARDEIQEAADDEEGSFDLPLRHDGSATGVSKGGPLAYSEASPFAWIDDQRRRIRGQ